MAVSLPTFSTFAQFLALTYVCTKAIHTLQYYLLYSSDLSQYKPASGSGSAWALVTGASDGIGKGFARELCRRGFNVVIHGRNEKKLLGIKDSLLKDFPDREVKLLVLDATNSAWTEDVDSMILAAVKGLNVTMLVNNIGGMGGIEPAFSSVAARTAAEADEFININARFMTQMTRALIPVLAAAKSRRAVIANVSSGVELLTSPYMAIYSAAKAYVTRFTIALEAELRAEGHTIDVHAFIVGEVATEKVGGEPGLFNPAVPTFVKAVVPKFGSRHVVSAPYWPHGIQVWIMASLLPAWVGERFVLAMTKKIMARKTQMKQEQDKGK